MRKVCTIFFIGVIGCVTTVLAIYFGLPITDADRIFAIFLLLGFAALIVDAFIGRVRLLLSRLAAKGGD